MRRIVVRAREGDALRSRDVSEVSMTLSLGAMRLMFMSSGGLKEA